MIESRTQKSIRNIGFALGGYCVSLVLQLANRLVFVKFLSAEYLGINGLFSNILSMLALSEMGIGGAIVYALYKPVADKDIEKIKSLMALYKKMYTAIGIFILSIGILITPLLHLFIKEMPDIPYLRLYFVLYVINIGMSYFYTYKRSLVICDQNEYISTITTMTSSILTRLIQIVILFFTHNYLIYLCIQIVFTRLENIVVARIADKKYPYLKDKNIEPLDIYSKKEIKRNVFAMMIHKIGDVVVNATDNLIVSKVLGLASVGLLSNYTMIFDTISSLVNRFFSSLTASLGNMVATEESEKSEQIFYRILFANFCLVSISTCCLYCLMQPFVKLWLGEKYIMNPLIVTTLCGCFYLMGMRKTALEFRSVAGLFWNDRYKAVVESLLNLSISIPLTYLYGIVGVKIGTIISTLLTSFWIEGFILYKKYFHKPVKYYYFVQLKYGCLTIAICKITSIICNCVKLEGLFALIIKAIICIAFSCGMYLLVFMRNDALKYYYGLIKSWISKKGK